MPFLFHTVPDHHCAAFGTVQNRRLEYASCHVIEPTLDISRAAWANISMRLGTPAHTPELAQAHNAMCEAERVSEEESEPEEEEELWDWEQELPLLHCRGS